MNSHRPHQLAAVALSLIVTLSLFSGVSQLAAPGHAGPWLVKAPAAGALGCARA